MKNLTFNDLADIYHERTGQQARIRSIDSVLEWAEKQTDIIEVDDEGYFHLKEKS